MVVCFSTQFFKPRVPHPNSSGSNSAKTWERPLSADSTRHTASLGPWAAAIPSRGWQRPQQPSLQDRILSSAPLCSPGVGGLREEPLWGHFYGDAVRATQVICCVKLYRALCSHHLHRTAQCHPPRVPLADMCLSQERQEFLLPSAA